MKRAAVAITGVALAAMLGPLARGAAAQCCSDCNLDNQVTVDEILTGINHALTGCSNDGICNAVGMSGIERVDFSSKADSTSPKKAFAKCPTGKKVIAGGAKVFTAGVATGPIALKASFPSDALDGWAATAEEMVPTDVKWFVTTFAICATAAP